MAAATASELAQIQTAATTYGLSPQTLLGVFGWESDFGTNEGPSSAGAEGPFQWLPPAAQPTDAQYGVTNANIDDFGATLVATSKYLKALGATSSPTSGQTLAALNKYNGNDAGPVATSYTNGVIQDGGTGAAAGSVSSEDQFNPSGGVLNGAIKTVTNLPQEAAGAVASGFTGLFNDFTSWFGKAAVTVLLLFLGGGLVLSAVHRQTGVSLPHAPAVVPV